MRISTEIESAAKIVGEERAIEYIAKAGFTAWDFSMFCMCGYDWKKHEAVPSTHPLAGHDYLKFARKLKEVGLNCGIVCNQSHAPFPSDCAEIRSYFKRAIECTAEAGGEICVIHPNNFASAEENAEMYSELLPFAKDCGVKIAAENMWNWDKEKDEATFAPCANPESFLEHFEVLNDDYFVACLDIGHAEMKGLGTSAQEMIHALSPKLAALHIHDNDRWHDSHQLPFTMQIDFGKVMKALKEINYQGDLTLESSMYLDGRTEDDLFPGVVDMANVAKRLKEMYDED